MVGESFTLLSLAESSVMGQADLCIVRRSLVSRLFPLSDRIARLLVASPSVRRPSSRNGNV